MSGAADRFVPAAAGLQALRDRQSFLWLNPDLDQAAPVTAPLGEADLLAAEARLARFAPLLCELFPETAEAGGIIESALLEPTDLAAAL